MEQKSRPVTTTRTAAGAIAAAVLGNEVLLLVGTAAGASFAVPQTGQDGGVMQIGAGAVLVASALPLAVALALSALLSRRWPRAVVVLRVVAVLVTIVSLSVPLSTGTDAGTRVLLAVMHLLVGGCYLVATARQRHLPTLRRAEDARAPERTR